MRILLVNPAPRVRESLAAYMRSPPMGLLQLAAQLDGHEVEILDLDAATADEATQLEQRVAAVDLVGVTCMTSMLGPALEVCRLARRHRVRTVLGGFHPTLAPEVVGRPEVDFVVRGEGEQTLQELADGVRPARILGLSYKRRGRAHHNAPRPLLADLDALPLPRKDLVDLSRYHYNRRPADGVEASRGCTFDCNFCCVTRFYGRSYRRKSARRVVQELEAIPSTQEVAIFVDDAFTLDHRRVRAICDGIEELGLQRRLGFACQSRVSDVARAPAMIERMAACGFKDLFIGFESLAPSGLRRMNKRTTLGQARRAVEICHANGIRILGSFIIGNLDETRQDTLATIRLTKELGIDQLMINIITPFPGTALWEEAVAAGWVEADFDWASWDEGPVMSTPHLSRRDLVELNNYAHRYFYMY